jgi:hypothetical protein
VGSAHVSFFLPCCDKDSAKYFTTLGYVVDGIYTICRDRGLRIRPQKSLSRFLRHPWERGFYSKPELFDIRHNTHNFDSLLGSDLSVSYNDRCYTTGVKVYTKRYVTSQTRNNTDNTYNIEELEGQCATLVSHWIGDQIYHLKLLRASEGTLSRWSWLYLQSLATTNTHWARVVGYGPFSLYVIHKEGLSPSSGDINRLMMMMMIEYKFTQFVQKFSTQQIKNNLATWVLDPFIPMQACSIFHHIIN